MPPKPSIAERAMRGDFERWGLKKETAQKWAAKWNGQGEQKNVEDEANESEDEAKPPAAGAAAKPA